MLQEIKKQVNESRTNEQNDDKHDNVDAACDSNLMEINMSCLMPIRPITINLKVHGAMAKALLDTGATKSLITKSEWLKTRVAKFSDKPNSIWGLGNAHLETNGQVKLEIRYFGRIMPTVFDIVEDSDIKYPIVLGIDFLVQNNIVINMHKKKISKRNEDGSVIDVYLNDESDVLSIIHEGVPVYSSGRVVVKPNQTVKVPIYMDIDDEDFDVDLGLLCFEGETKNKYIESVNGIMDRRCVEPFVYVRLAETTAIHGVIKKDENLGRVNTILLLDDEEGSQEEQLDDSWTHERIQKEIRLQNNLTKGEREKVFKMLHDVKGALSKSDADIGKAKVTPHHIELTNNTPIWQKARSFAEPINLEIEKQCQELMANDILEYSNSQWSSPVVPVRKSDNTLRLCIDYRKVNQVTLTQNHPMPNLNHSIYRAHNIKFFTKLDLVRGYYQVPLDEESRPITAFSTTRDHFQFKRLSFGLKNSGMAFQKSMQQVLSPFLSNNIIVYIDDILIMSESFDEHLELVSKVLTTLYRNDLKIKVKKCEFFQSSHIFDPHH